jgi:hypothetical protein
VEQAITFYLYRGSSSQEENMRKINSEYPAAMQAYDDFFEMLFSAIKTVAPEIKISRSGAYVWRSYRIDKYMDLATGPYNFNIYHDSPETLEFLENFFFKGKPYSQTIESVNLEEEGFFDLDKADQMNLLENFVRVSLEKGKVWQNSDERRDWVPEDVFNGTKPRLKPKTAGKSVGKISVKYLLAMPMQDYLLDLLCDAIYRIGPEFYPGKPHLEPNASWFNWDFRGYRMWNGDADGAKPDGPCEYLWRIYMDKDEWDKVYFLRNDDPDADLPSLEMNADFLNASKPEQIKAIDEFVRKAFNSQLPVI